VPAGYFIRLGLHLEDRSQPAVSVRLMRPINMLIHVLAVCVSMPALTLTTDPEPPYVSPRAQPRLGVSSIHPTRHPSSFSLLILL
jgi:hypothetical protein